MKDSKNTVTGFEMVKKPYSKPNVGEYSLKRDDVLLVSDANLQDVFNDERDEWL